MNLKMAKSGMTEKAWNPPAVYYFLELRKYRI
jgi:hypothetical protein